MNERFVKRHGKLCLLAAFLLSAAVSGCNWRDEGTPAFEQMTVFENASDAPVLLSIDARLVSEIEGKRTYFHTTDAGQHTYSAVGKYDRVTVGGGTFSAGGYVRIPR